LGDRRKDPNNTYLTKGQKLHFDVRGRVVQQTAGKRKWRAINVSEKVGRKRPTAGHPHTPRKNEVRKKGDRATAGKVGRRNPGSTS